MRPQAPDAALLATPRIMYDPDRRLALLWSPKCGCTFGVKWFLHHAGLLEEALAYHRWVHHYRQQRFYARPGYAEGIGALLEPDFRILKLVRDPYERAVSSYAFLLKTRVSRPRRGREIMRALGLHGEVSFRGFLEVLASEPRRLFSNPHFAPQLHPAEAAGLLPHARVLRLEDSMDRLPLIEQEWGLPATDLAAFRSSHHHSSARDATPGFCGERVFWPQAGLALPASPQFYDATTRALVEQVYAMDFAAYGYADSPVPG